MDTLFSISCCIKKLTTLLSIACILLFSLILHLYQLESIPRGIFSDEASIGINAASIARTAHDEHGVLLPLYFKAFGEYKNPLYIYMVAGFFKIFGISDVVLRSTSVFFFILFQIGLWLLMQILGLRKITQYSILLFSTTLPYFFAVSRISFEVVSLLPVTIFLLYVYIKSTDLHRPRTYAFFCGVLLMLTFLSYSTQRLLAPLYGLGILFIYLKHYKKNILPFVGGIMPFLLGLGYFFTTNPNALTERFSSITYLSSHDIHWWTKIYMFFSQYASYFSPDFLLISGDPLLRHHTGSGGMLFLSVALPALFGIGTYIAQFKKEKMFWHVVFCMFLLSPIPAALTNDPMHSLRSITLGISILLFAGRGIEGLLTCSKIRILPYILTALLLLFSFESYRYLSTYFTTYPAHSMTSFETAGLQQSLNVALSKENTKLFITSKNPRMSTIIRWYEFVYPELTKKSIEFTEKAPNSKNSCHIFPEPTPQQLFTIQCSQ